MLNEVAWRKHCYLVLQPDRCWCISHFSAVVEEKNVIPKGIRWKSWFILVLLAWVVCNFKKYAWPSIINVVNNFIDMKGGIINVVNGKYLVYSDNLLNPMVQNFRTNPKWLRNRGSLYSSVMLTAYFSDPDHNATLEFHVESNDVILVDRFSGALRTVSAWRRHIEAHYKACVSGEKIYFFRWYTETSLLLTHKGLSVPLRISESQ